MKNSMDIINRTLARGQLALSEYDSKRFLSSYGIPVSREVIAENADSAASEAVKIGFPVVLRHPDPSCFTRRKWGALS